MWGSKGHKTMDNKRASRRLRRCLRSVATDAPGGTLLRRCLIVWSCLELPLGDASSSATAMAAAAACGSGRHGTPAGAWPLDSYVETPEAPFAVALVLVVLACFGLALVVAVELCVFYSLSRASSAAAEAYSDGASSASLPPSPFPASSRLTSSALRLSTPPQQPPPWTTAARSRWRSLWLGQLLLAALSLCYATLFAFAMRPSAAACAVQRFAVGACYALVFAALLVKALSLLASHRAETAGSAGGPLTCARQLLLVALLWLVQLVADAEWLVLSTGGGGSAAVQPALPIALNASVAASMSPSPHAGSGRDVLRTYCRCAGWYFAGAGGAFYDQLASLTYVALQLAALLALSVRAHRLPGNHGEGKWISVSAVAVAVVWVLWVSAGCLLVKDKDAAVALGLWATATVVLTALFVPKLHWLARAERPKGEPRDIINLDDNFSDLGSTATLTTARSPDYAHWRNVQRTPSPSTAIFSRRSCTPVQLPLAHEGAYHVADASRHRIYEEVLPSERAAAAACSTGAHGRSSTPTNMECHGGTHVRYGPPSPVLQQSQGAALQARGAECSHYLGDPNALELHHPGYQTYSRRAAATGTCLNAADRTQCCQRRKYLCRVQNNHTKRSTKLHVHRRTSPRRPASLPGDLHRIDHRSFVQASSLSRPKRSHRAAVLQFGPENDGPSETST